MIQNDDIRPWIKSYDKGLAPDIEIPDKTCVDLLEESMKENPDRPVIYYMDKIFRFRDLDDLSARFASYLYKKGIGPGKVVDCPFRCVSRRGDRNRHIPPVVSP